MSRIGKIPVLIPEGVTVSMERNRAEVTGPKGKAEVKIPIGVEVTIQKDTVKVVSGPGNLQGLTRALLSNAVAGVTRGWTKTLELSGTGYRAAVAGGDLQLALGFSHPVTVKAQPGIEFNVKENKITVSGISRDAVGQMSATIRQMKPADPYKAKGFKYEGERIVRKAGKAAKAPGAAK